MIQIRDSISDNIHKEEIERITKRQLAESQPILKEYFFSHILENHYQKREELLFHLERLSINLADQPLVVVVFYFDVEKQSSPYFTEDDRNLLRAAVMNIIDEGVNCYRRVIFPHGKKEIVVILNAHSLPEKLNTLLQFLLDAIYSYCKIYLDVGIGITVEGLMDASKSYQAAEEALAYNIYETAQHIFEAALLNRNETRTGLNNLNVEEIVEAIYCGKQEEVNVLLHSFFHELFYVQIPPPNYIRGMCIHLVAEVQKVLLSYIDDQSVLFQDDPYKIIYELHSFREMKQWIESTFFRYMEELSAYGKHKKSPLIQKAMEYIEVHSRSKIRASDVADHVGLSENYFTVYFKEKTGENFKKFIDKLRMDQAKELMKQGDKTIYEIADLVGYDDYRSFGRSFKKMVKMTPSEYMQQLQK